MNIFMILSLPIQEWCAFPFIQVKFLERGICSGQLCKPVSSTAIKYFLSPFIILPSVTITNT